MIRHLPRDRVSTGIANLDAVLEGGLLPGSLTVVSGPPGSGKTILSQQLASRRYAERRARMLSARRGSTDWRALSVPRPTVKPPASVFARSSRLSRLSNSPRSTGGSATRRDPNGNFIEATLRCGAALPRQTEEASASWGVATS